MQKIERKYGLMSIQNRILVFALLITLIPSFGMGWLLNNMMHDNVTEKTEQKLRHTSNIIEREISLWFKERNYDLYVFSNSFVISENYSRYLNAGQYEEGENIERPAYIRTIKTYLTSVQKQFDDYNRLFVLSKDGSIVASSSTQDKDMHLRLPADMAEQVKNNKYIKSQVYFDEQSGFPLMVIGIPLFAEQFEEYVGILAIEVSLNRILHLFKTAFVGVNWETPVHGSLIRLQDGVHFLSTDESENLTTSITTSKGVLKLFDGLLKLQDFTNHKGARVVGILSPLEQLKWGMIISENYEDVFVRVASSRNRIVFAVCMLGLIIGLMAYFLARQIIKPLKALTQGAQLVAEGNLDVHLSIKKNDELGLATQVFNEMVAELHQSQTKLEQLATIDALTQLCNRKEIMKNLLNHFEYFQRYNTEFSVLMIDVDHFKRVNDTYGHQAGDAILSEIGEIFSEQLRNADSAGRYGGEEFLILLAESSEVEALQVAERIRQRVCNRIFVYKDHKIKMSVSIGIAKILPTDENENCLVNRADKALYEAKRNGRNQTIFIRKPTQETSDVGKVVSIVRPAEK